MTSDADTSAEKEKVFHGCVPPVFLPEVHLSAPFYIAHGQKIGIAGLFLPGTSCAIARETFFSQHHPKTMAAREGWFSREKEGGEPEEAASACLSQNNAGFMEASKGSRWRQLANAKFSPKLSLSKVVGGILKPPQQDEGHIATMDVQKLCRCYFGNK